MMQTAVKTKKPRKQDVSGRFWAMRTYRGRIKDDHKIDPACGTGGMLSVAEDYLKKLNSSATLLPFGQEINDETFAICKADMLIKGNDSDKIKCGNTLSGDEFKGETFDYILSNPPFGREWKNDKTAIEKEAKLGAGGRFGYGLPAVGDGQMLFLLTAISKMTPLR
jgi:type I restriction enzyme M protein